MRAVRPTLLSLLASVSLSFFSFFFAAFYSLPETATQIDGVTNHNVSQLEEASSEKNLGRRNEENPWTSFFCFCVLILFFLVSFLSRRRI
jgi:hypothetical protein